MKLHIMTYLIDTEYSLLYFTVILLKLEFINNNINEILVKSNFSAMYLIERLKDSVIAYVPSTRKVIIRHDKVPIYGTAAVTNEDLP